MTMNDYAHPQALVETSWLQERLDDPAIRIIDVDEDTTAYGKAHIPGSVGWDWSCDLHADPRRDYVDRAALSTLLSHAGVEAGMTVVLYGGNNNWFASYAYWIMKLRGFDAVRLLDGGRKRWELDGRTLTTDEISYAPTGYSISGPERPAIRALRDELLARVGSDTGLVDVRSPDEFAGRLLAPPHLPQEQAQVPGHIPGAVNVPWARAANDDGTFRPAAELRALYAEHDIIPDRPIIAYCRIGERSSHTWFALTELLGYPDVKNYDGSWTEYGSLVGVPVEKG
jgi:thiosulfate/3-mercaptopyruvate sulfurtransferase